MGPKVKEPICSGCKQKGHKYPACPKNPKNAGKVASQTRTWPIAPSLDVSGSLLSNYFRIDTGDIENIYCYGLIDVRAVLVHENETPSRPDPSSTTVKQLGKPKLSDCQPQTCSVPECHCNPKLPPLKPEEKPVTSKKPGAGSESVKSGKQKVGSQKAPNEPGVPGEPMTPGTTQSPRRIPARVLRRIVHLLIQNIRDEHDVAIASDYASQLVTTKKIISETVPGHWEVSYYDEDETEPRPNALRYHVEVTTPRELSLPSLMDFVKNPNSFTDTQGNSMYHDKGAVIKALNLIFSHRPCQDRVLSPMQDPTVTSIGLNKFYSLHGPGSRSDTNAALEAKAGFFRSVRSAIKSELLLNINTTTGAFYRAGTLKDLMVNFDPRKGRGALEKFIRGIRVKTNNMHRSAVAAGMNLADAAQVRERIFTVTGLPFLHHNPIPSNVFFTEDVRSPQVTERPPPSTRSSPSADNPRLQKANPASTPNRISVGQYFAREHRGITLAVNQHSCWVVSLGRKPIFLPAELLSVLPGQNFKEKTEMVQVASRWPTENANLINNQGMQIFRLIRQRGQHNLESAFGISVRQGMVRVKPAMLGSPLVAYRTNVVNDNQCQKGSLNMQEREFSQPATDKVWTYIELTLPGRERNSRGTDDNILQNFENQFGQKMETYGITGCKFVGLQFFKDHRIALNGRLDLYRPNRDGHENTQSQAIEKAVLKIKAEATRTGLKLDLVIVLLPDKDAGTFAMVKRLFDQKLDIHSMCHVTKYYGQEKYYGPKFDEMFFANLYMKFNLKLNSDGANQVLQVKPTPMDGGNTMIMGMDVTHPGAGALKDAPSVAAVVASMDEHFSQWPAELRINPGPKESMEEIVDLEDMVFDLLVRYRDRRGKLPTTIIIYRDGLSEEQLEKTCKDVDYPRVMTALARLYGNATPRVTLICTVKRHHTRFFPHSLPVQTSGNYVDNNKNPKPGCLVDNVVTSGTGMDFFLVSHKVIKGTARPTHYVVLDKPEEFTMIDIEKMTHALCYIFGRTTQSVGLATPAYYADLAADRARCYVRRTYVPCASGPLGNGQYDEHSFDLALANNMRGSMFYI